MQLQTNFGGGKTHSLIALYHLAGGHEPATLPGVEQMLAESGVGAAAGGAAGGAGRADDRPRLAAIRSPTGRSVHTLWGELAWQLGGAEGYALVAQADEARVNPGEALITLLAAVLAVLWS